MKDSTVKSINDFIKLKNNSDASSPTVLIVFAFILLVFGWFSGLEIVELLLLSAFEFAFSLFLIIKTYNKEISDKSFNFYCGTYGISLSIYSQVLFFCANFKNIGIITLFFSVLLLLLNLLIVVALLLYVCVKIKKGVISKATYILSSFAGVGAVAGMLFAERHRGEVVFISNVGYILSSVMCSAFIVCLLKYMLYKLLEYKDNEENKNIFLKLLEKAIS